MVYYTLEYNTPNYPTTVYTAADIGFLSMNYGQYNDCYVHVVGEASSKLGMVSNLHDLGKSKISENMGLRDIYPKTCINVAKLEDKLLTINVTMKLCNNYGPTSIKIWNNVLRESLGI